MADNQLIPLSQAVEAIKTAILQGQYEANKDVNRIQLAVYFAIGKYLSKNTRNLEYGTGAIKAISDRLHKELPGLRGYSETSLKNMRKFYDNWNMLDAESCVTTPESESTIAIVDSSQQSAVATAESRLQQSAVVTAELQKVQNQIDIYHSIYIPNVAEFPIEVTSSRCHSHTTFPSSKRPKISKRAITRSIAQPKKNSQLKLSRSSSSSRRTRIGH